MQNFQRQESFFRRRYRTEW